MTNKTLRRDAKKKYAYLCGIYDGIDQCLTILHANPLGHDCAPLIVNNLEENAKHRLACLKELQGLEIDIIRDTLR